MLAQYGQENVAIFIGNKVLNYWDRTFSQNQSLSVGSIWTVTCKDFYWKIKDLSYWDRTVSQNQNLSVGLIWTRKCIDFYCKRNDLSRADRTLSQNQNLNVGSILTKRYIDFYWKIIILAGQTEHVRKIKT